MSFCIKKDTTTSMCIYVSCFLSSSRIITWCDNVNFNINFCFNLKRNCLYWTTSSLGILILFRVGFINCKLLSFHELSHLLQIFMSDDHCVRVLYVPYLIPPFQTFRRHYSFQTLRHEYLLWHNY